MKTVEAFWNAVEKNLHLHRAIFFSRVPKNNTNTIDVEVVQDEIFHFKRLQLESLSKFINNYTSFYLPYINHLIEEIERYSFFQYPSVNSTFHEHLLSITTNYQLLSKINLESHTLNVVYETAKMSRELPSQIKSINIILALLHDFGKCNEIKKDLKEKKEKHWKISAEYASRTMMHFDIPLPIRLKIVQILTYHHDSPLNNFSDEAKNIQKIKNDDLFLHLCHADSSARENEIHAITKDVYYEE
ncbi:MAG: hypothetical protein COB67_00200 [SAR324 cluster bacterium]|uniref:HD domain-containing protein n=1 Tax=SAR324 cluster bacterium TaxID=2024889 RepID=A0A2A4TBC4_9DELT|nr:MAG: hypothetical protein COB67_00200 [SAR324 cluster bacterium]